MCTLTQGRGGKVPSFFEEVVTEVKLVTVVLAGYVQSIYNILLQLVQLVVMVNLHLLMKDAQLN